MRVLVDTSAYYALASASDNQHEAAEAIYARLLAQGDELWTISYVVLETAALIQMRLGMRALRLFRRSLSAATNVIWVSEDLHAEAWDELERLPRRRVSLVDCCLAVTARREGIETLFAFDPHFKVWNLKVAGPGREE